MKTALDPRHQKRQEAAQELFAWVFKKQKVSSELAKKVLENLEIIDKTVAENAPEFPLDRINGVDLAVLRLAVYELMVARAEPVKVIIDEAVELAKEFGGETSPAFVNGVLGKILVSPVRIRRAIADSLGVEEEKIVPEANLQADFNATDLEIADLMAKLEKELNIPFADNSAIHTVGDILNYIEDHRD